VEDRIHASALTAPVLSDQSGAFTRVGWREAFPHKRVQQGRFADLDTPGDRDSQWAIDTLADGPGLGLERRTRQALLSGTS
jgi:hypothetical protein